MGRRRIRRGISEGFGSEALEVGWSGGGVRGLDTICLMYFVDGIRILALALLSSGQIVMGYMSSFRGFLILDWGGDLFL